MNTRLCECGTGALELKSKCGLDGVNNEMGWHGRNDRINRGQRESWGMRYCVW